jgi:hypothetical protein
MLRMTYSVPVTALLLALSCIPAGKQQMPALQPELRHFADRSAPSPSLAAPQRTLPVSGLADGGAPPPNPLAVPQQTTSVFELADGGAPPPNPLALADFHAFTI